MGVKRIRIARPVLLGLLAAGALAGVTAAPAEAFTAYTGGADAGVDSVTVYGYIDTSNYDTDWAFNYGSSIGYGSWSSVGTIPPGSGTVMVAAVLSRLSPLHRYHFRLVAVPMTRAGADRAAATFGSDVSFSTQREHLGLLAGSLSIRGGAVRIPLKCVSDRACAGAVSLTARDGRRSIGCATTNFRLGAGESTTAATMLTRRCLSLVRQARAHRLGVVLRTRPSTGQPVLRAPVTLMG